MNCQDIARILDEQEVDSLLAEEHSGVQAHLALCGECARDWQIHSQLSHAEIPAVPAELRAHYAAQMAGVARVGANRRGRFIVIGTLVAMAAAAAMRTVQLTGSRAPVAAVADPAHVEPSVIPAAIEATTSSVVSEVRALETEPLAIQTASTPVVTGASNAGLRILMMPVQYNSGDNAATPAIEAFHSALLQALRNTPDVVVEVVGAGSANDQPANRVTVVSPRITTQASGRPVYRSGDGQRTWQEMMGTYRPYSGPPRWPVEVMLKSAKNPGGQSNVDQFVDGSGIPARSHCSANMDNPVGEVAPSLGPATSNEYPAMCSSAEGLAAWLIAAMRPGMRQPVADTAQLISRLADASTYDRPGAFSELVGRARREGVVLDAVAIAAITSYIGSNRMPEQRVSSLIMLRGIRQPALVVPLLQFLQHDDDEKVRLEALSTLVGDYGNDSRVSTAIESVARQDASSFVRMIAQRQISGDAQWESHVLATLADRSLSVADRLKPAQYDVQQTYFPGASRKLPSYLESEQVARQLLDIFQELRTAVRPPETALPAGMPSALAERLAELGAAPGGAAGQQPDGAMQSVLILLGLTNPTAETDLRIRILTETPLPPTWLAVSSLNALLDKRDDPRASKVLDDIAAGKSGAELRNILERNMATRK